MAKRKDGKETKQKLLDAACEVFAEKGFREAKITEICRRAGANVAAVNYYFGDKDSLYVAAWRQAMENSSQRTARCRSTCPLKSDCGGRYTILCASSLSRMKRAAIFAVSS